MRLFSLRNEPGLNLAGVLFPGSRMFQLVFSRCGLQCIWLHPYNTVYDLTRSSLQLPVCLAVRTKSTPVFALSAGAGFFQGGQRTEARNDVRSCLSPIPLGSANTRGSSRRTGFEIRTVELREVERARQGKARGKIWMLRASGRSQSATISFKMFPCHFEDVCLVPQAYAAKVRRLCASACLAVGTPLLKPERPRI